MKLLVLLCLVAAVAARSPPRVNDYSKTDDVQLRSYDNNFYDNRSYKYSFDQSDGTKAEQQGELRNEGQENEYLAVKGSYSWVGPDGVTYLVNYVADDNGYQPEIEQGPGGGVPPAVVASLLG